MPVLSAVNEEGTTASGSLIDEMVREGARRMLAAALATVFKPAEAARASTHPPVRKITPTCRRIAQGPERRPHALPDGSSRTLAPLNRG
ncbi:hypothetical protein ACQYWQ_23980 [Streptomyces sp. P6-2-1]|uniref:hypothetical protein n=1 Tax=Streptomyces sp. P6-2-1 TaxID=3422591 RepID=UPI003D35F14A